MMPTAARDLLALDIAEADAMAAKGEVDAGQRLLLAGLRRAETAMAAGQTWAEEWVGCYRAAVNTYIHTYIVRV